MHFKSRSEQNAMELLFQHSWYASKQKQFTTICDFFEKSPSPLNVSISQFHPYKILYANKQLLDYYGIKPHENITKISKNLDKKILHPSSRQQMYETVARIQQTRTVGNIIASVRKRLDQEDYFWRFCTMRILPEENLLFTASVPLDKLFGLEHSIKHQTRISNYQQQHFQKFMSLSEREREVLQLTMQGCTNKSTANQLFISLDTVKQHLQNIRKKTGLKNFAQLMRFAQSFGLI